MDKGVIKLVNYFNEHGLKTYMSCEGHYPWRPSMSLFWISFDKEVSDEDIRKFKVTHPELNGWFVKRLIYDNWLERRYVAANRRIAKRDYKLLIDF